MNRLKKPSRSAASSAGRSLVLQSIHRRPIWGILGLLVLIAVGAVPVLLLYHPSENVLAEAAPGFVEEFGNWVAPLFRMTQSPSKPTLAPGINFLRTVPESPGSMSVFVTDANQPGHVWAGAGGTAYRKMAVTCGFDVLINAANENEAIKFLQELHARDHRTIVQIVIADYGTFGLQTINHVPLGDALFRTIGDVTEHSNANLVLTGSRVGSGTKGRAYLHHIADTFGLSVTARTVSNHFSAWFFHYGVKLDAGYWKKAIPQQKELLDLQFPEFPTGS